MSLNNYMTFGIFFLLLTVLLTIERTKIQFRNLDTNTTYVLNTNDLYHFILLYNKPISPTSLCGIESLHTTLINNPNSYIWVWMSNTSFWPIELSGNERIKVMHANFTALVKETPLETFYDRKGFDYGTYDIQNRANALRLAIVYKFGGMYIDADFVVINDPSSLGYGIHFQDSGSLNNAAFSFKRESRVLKSLMQDFALKYNGNRWGHQGPQMFNRMFLHEGFLDKRFCYINKTTMKVICGLHQETINVWSYERISPLPWYAWPVLLKRANKGLIDEYKNNGTIMIHTWNKMSGKMEEQYCKKAGFKHSLIGLLRERYCPTSFRNQIIKVHNKHAVLNEHNK